MASTVDRNANQKSLLVLIGDVDSAERLDLLPVRHQDDAKQLPPPPTSSSVIKDVENRVRTRTQLGRAKLDVDEATGMTSPSLLSSPSSSSSSAAEARHGVSHCEDDAAAAPSDDVYKYLSDDVIRTQRHHDRHEPTTDKVHAQRRYRQS